MYDYDMEKALEIGGRQLALDLQAKSRQMTGTELNAESNLIPRFQSCIATENMLNREPGFVCKSTAGRVVKLLQKYDSDVFPGEPEELPAQWGFLWSTDPRKALPFVAISTSPYNIGDCCIDADRIWRSKIDSNVFRPSDYEAGWELV